MSFNPKDVMICGPPGVVCSFLRCCLRGTSSLLMPADPQAQSELSIEDFEPLLSLARKWNVLPRAIINDGSCQDFLARLKGRTRPVVHYLALEEASIVAHADAGVCDLS